MSEAERYRPISAYGLIGDCHSAALVSDRGSIDWLCTPRFDAPSLFARILDAGRGGHFAVHPVGDFRSRHEYVGYSGVLRTTFETATGAITLTDFMPLGAGVEPLRWARPRAPGRLVRLIEGIHGEVELAVEIEPRPDYGYGEALLSGTSNGLLIETRGGARYRLHGPVPFSVSGSTATAALRVRSGEHAALALELADERAAGQGDGVANVLAQLDRTLIFWNEWCARCRYRGLYEQPVMRSALTLKLLSFAPTGAMVAAPTTSLPEHIGGVRNWDYRYTWIRDASFAAHALFIAGHIEDGTAFMQWVCDVALRCKPGELQAVYGLAGERDLREQALERLEGYRGSRPVRVGNAGSTQFQLDAYGELLDSFHTYRRVGTLTEDACEQLWPVFRHQVDFAADHWREPDSGMWEMRSAPRHFVHSKAMAWVALDRGIKAAEEMRLPANVARWRSEREAVRNDVLERGYDPGLRSFTQSYGDRVLDATSLLLPLVGFIEVHDARMASTIDAVARKLTVNGLVYRYRGVDDGLPGEEAAFAACTFWLVENLVALGRVPEAKALFDGMLSRATPLGLFAEEFDAWTNIHLGNFPQALTHIALMNAGVNLTRAL